MAMARIESFAQEMVAAANVVGPKSNGQEAPVPRPDAFHMFPIFSLSVVTPHVLSVGPANFKVPNEVDEEPYVEEDDEAWLMLVVEFSTLSPKKTNAFIGAKVGWIVTYIFRRTH